MITVSPDRAFAKKHATSTPVVLHTRVVNGTGGGPDKTILNSPRFLAPHGYRTLCAYMRPRRDPGFEQLRRRADELDATLISVNDEGPLDVSVIVRLLHVCRRHRVKIWHGHDYKSNAIGLLLRKFWPMRLVSTVHGWVKFTRRTPLYYAIDRICLRYYDRVICVSNDLLEQCLAKGISPRKCVLIENAVDTTQFSRTMSTAAAKRTLGLAADRLLVGAVGRLSAEKGFDVLIRSVDRLLARGLNLDVIIVGEGDARGELQRLVSRLGRDDRIRLLGFRADTIKLFQAMDVFVLSSIREGLPNVLLEAMALQVPVVATEVAGVKRIIEDESNGLIVSSGDIQSLTERLAQVLTDGTLRRQLSTRARQTIEDRYSFSQRMQQIREIYRGLV